MRKKLWIGGSALSALTAFFIAHKTTFTDAFIYDAVSRFLDFIFKGFWPAFVLLSIGGIVWFALSRPKENRLMLRESPHSRIASFLEEETETLPHVGRWIGLGVILPVLLVVAFFSAERLAFPFLARQLTSLPQRLITLMYIPRRWDKSDPIATAAMFKLSVEMMKKYGEPIPGNNQYIDALNDLIGRKLITCSTKPVLNCQMTKKGIRFGAYLVQREPPIKARLNPQGNKS